MTKYRQTFSAGSKQISTANQVIDFYSESYPKNNCNVQFLHFQTFEQECYIRLNDENSVHWIDANSEFVIEDITIDKFTIIDAGVSYYYTALSAD